MKLLLDTHLLLWAAEDYDRLPKAAQTLLDDPAHTFFFSVVSIWEVVIKASRGKGAFILDPLDLYQGLLRNGYRELPVSAPQVLAVGALPPIHKDPFDRLLLAQAQVENLTLLTADALLARYPGPVHLV